MNYLDFIELMDFFKEDINAGFAEVLSDNSDESFQILVITINSETIKRLDEKGYYTSIFGAKDYKVQLMISKKTW